MTLALSPSSIQFLIGAMRISGPTPSGKRFPFILYIIKATPVLVVNPVLGLLKKAKISEPGVGGGFYKTVKSAVYTLNKNKYESAREKNTK